MKKEKNANKQEDTQIQMHWDSTLINSTTYDYVKETLVVDFLSGGSYLYTGVTNRDYLEFSNADSQGKHFIANIRSNFTHEKINDN